MTIRRGLHVADADGEGADALEARLALAGLFTSFGVLEGFVVTGRASWAYNVAAGKVVSSRSAADGAVLFANDSTAIVGTGGEGTTVAPAPATGSRIDIIYVLHRDVDNGDADSLPVFGVASGTASGSPVAPTIPAGAVELARATLAAGATNTAHANVTISHTNTPRAYLRGTDPSGKPFATAAGVLTGTTVGGVLTNNWTVPLPAGRFTVAPIVTAMFANLAGSSGKFVVRANASTTTASSTQINIYQGDGTNMPAGVSVTVNWTAVQMTPTTAAG